MLQFIEDIKREVIDVNNLESFFGILTKGFLYHLNNILTLRGEPIPHLLLNTGDDILYLEIKGHNMNVEPNEVSNEDFIYNKIPRCIVQPNGITILADQLSAWSNGVFQLEHNGALMGVVSDFRRFPVKMNMSLKYYFDSYTDALNVAQQIIAKEAFVNTFEIVYLGQRINCSYQLPDSEDIEKMIEFDGLTLESKSKTISFDFDVESNLPILLPSTVEPSDSYIKETVHGWVKDPNNSVFDKNIKV